MEQAIWGIRGHRKDSQISSGETSRKSDAYASVCQPLEAQTAMSVGKLGPKAECREVSS